MLFQVLIGVLDTRRYLAGTTMMVSALVFG